jgi:N-acetylmuramoyl-L-alanine amidase
MGSAVFRWAAAATLAWCSAGLLIAAGPRRAAATPSIGASVHIPGAPRPGLKFGELEYVAVGDVAQWLGFKAVWTEPQRRARLTDLQSASNRVELESDSRSALVDGLRVDLGNPVLARNGQLYISEIDLLHCLVPLMRPAALPASAAPRVIALDAGHGGGDNGMENVRLGLKEKVLTLDVVLRVKKLLESAGFQVVLTRKTDQTFSSDKAKDLPMRTEVANRAGAELFVSVHFNSLYPDTKTSGTEVYVYTPPHQRSSQGWAIGEKDDSKPPQPVNRFDPWSSLLAHHLHGAVIRELKTADRGQKTKHLLVLQDLKCPAALVESVFLSNDTEARRAATPEYRQRIAESIAAGIRAYVADVRSAKSKPATSVRRAPARSS